MMMLLSLAKVVWGLFFLLGTLAAILCAFACLVLSPVAAFAFGHLFFRLIGLHSMAPEDVREQTRGAKLWCGMLLFWVGWMTLTFLIDWLSGGFDGL